MNALPILLLGGAALLMMGGGKNKKEGSPKPKKVVMTRSSVKKATAEKFTVKPTKSMKGKLGMLTPLSETGGGGGASDAKAWVNQHAAAICEQPRDLMNKQAMAYAGHAVKAMRRASGAKLKITRDKMPCNDKERLSWVVDEAFRLWAGGLPGDVIGGEQVGVAKRWVIVEPRPGITGGKYRPWNTMNAEQGIRSLTALTHKGGMRYVTKLNLTLSPCALQLRGLLTWAAIRNCPGVVKSVFPWK